MVWDQFRKLVIQAKAAGDINGLELIVAGVPAYGKSPVRKPDPLLVMRTGWSDKESTSDDSGFDAIILIAASARIDWAGGIICLKNRCLERSGSVFAVRVLEAG